MSNKLSGNICFVRNSLNVFLGIVVLFSAFNLQAQINLGNMTMTPKVDDETNQLLSDATHRRVTISPAHVPVNSIQKTTTIELHNPTKDTLNITLFLSDTVVGLSRFVSVESVTESSDPKVKNRKLIDQNSGDSISSIYRPMSSWIKDLPKSVQLAPGEKKNVSVTVEIPATGISGEYASWIVAEVEPRKKGPNTKKVVYTISNAKITHNTELESSESQGAK